MKVLELEKVNKSFGDVKAVSDLSFNLESGRVFGFLGPNGAGKTTTIRMIMNIIIPDSGSISLMGNKHQSRLSNRIGYLPEERGIYRKMKVKEVLHFLAELKNMKRSEATKSINHWLERFDLSEWQKKKVEELSKGMQQKLQFIATIMFDPELIILDEPFLGLDPINTRLLKEIIMEQKKKGKTIIFSTHSMDSAEKLCDEILLINKGKNVLSGKLGDVKKSYGKQNIQLSYEGSGNFLENNPDVMKIDDSGSFVELQLKPETDAQKFLAELIQHYKIFKFEIMEPSLNDIFIEAVSDHGKGRENE